MIYAENVIMRPQSGKMRFGMYFVGSYFLKEQCCSTEIVMMSMIFRFHCQIDKNIESPVRGASENAYEGWPC